MAIRILFFGDIVGKPGREAVKKVLPGLRERYGPDFVLANVENVAHGAGIGREQVGELHNLGMHGFTTGDHTFDKAGADDLLQDSAFPIVRPLNWPGDVPGRGWRILEKDGRRLLLLNALGRVCMKISVNDFFDALELALQEASKEAFEASFLDFHAGATSEKRAVAEYFDGRINVVVGTHTHVQTNDAQTLSRGTGFLTDVGMCGPQDSILGADKNIIIQKLRTQRPAVHELAGGPCEIHACVATVEGEKTTMETVRLRGVAV